MYHWTKIVLTLSDFKRSRHLTHHESFAGFTTSLLRIQLTRVHMMPPPTSQVPQLPIKWVGEPDFPQPTSPDTAVQNG